MANKLEWYGGNGVVSIEKIREEIERQIAYIAFDLSEYAKKEDVPQNISDLNNDSGYQTAAEVDSAIDAKLSGYQPVVTIDDTLSDTSENPVQNKAIKAALDSISLSGVIVDSVISADSENPVQNKIIAGALDDKQDKLTAGDSISIEKNAGGDTVISYTGEIGGITEDQARQIAAEQAAEKIAEGNFAKVDDIPTNISDLNDDVGYAKTSDIPDEYDDTQIKADIGKVQEDLANYYLKNETYSKDEIDNIVANINSLDIVAVTTLPTQNIRSDCIYLVKDSLVENNLYSEWIYIDDKWEKFGSAFIDTSNLVTKEDIETALEDYPTKDEMDISISEAVGEKVGYTWTWSASERQMEVKDDILGEVQTIPMKEIALLSDLEGLSDNEAVETTAAEVAALFA